MQKDRVVVAMSGGVDSSVAAALLQEQGYDVIGVTMKLWDTAEVGGGEVNRESGCCSLDTIHDARAVCDQLGVPHYVWNLSEEFGSSVIDNFVQEYLDGRTPNPCVMCNRHIKWGTFLAKSRSLGARFIATGHYARIVPDPQTGQFALHKSSNLRKDQSYALWGIRRDALPMTLFPVGDMTKDQVRTHAARLGLRTAKKAESQEICFVVDNDYNRFLKEKVAAIQTSLADGSIVTRDGREVGHHDGYPFYTIGQRRGVGVAMNEPVYVTEIRARENVIVIGPKTDLLSRGLIARQINVLRDFPAHFSVTAKIRYNDPGHPAVARILNQEIHLRFDSAQPAVTPGQSVVLYDGDEVLGGGIIERALKD